MGKFIAVAGLVPIVAAYISLAVTTREVSFWLWEVKTLLNFGFIVVPIMTLSVWAECMYRSEKSEAELFKRFCDFDEYKTMPFLDYMVAHYGKVAFTGLILGVVIYSIRPLVKALHPLFVAIPVPLATVVIFFVYALFMIKMVYVFRARIKHFLLVGLALVVVLFIDIRVLNYLIDSVPQFVEKTER